MQRIDEALGMLVNDIHRMKIQMSYLARVETLLRETDHNKITKRLTDQIKGVKYFKDALHGYMFIIQPEELDYSGTMHFYERVDVSPHEMVGSIIDRMVALREALKVAEYAHNNAAGVELFVRDTVELAEKLKERIMSPLLPLSVREALREEVRCAMR